MKTVNLIKEFYLLTIHRKSLEIEKFNELNLKINEKNTKINKEMVHLYYNYSIIAVRYDGYSSRFIIL
jgi:hypothetical protein